MSYRKRLPELPDVPTFKEVGLMDMPITQGMDFWGPPNLPRNLFHQISKAIEKAVKDPGYLEFCNRVGYQPVFKDAQAREEDARVFEKNIGPMLLAAFPQK